MSFPRQGVVTVRKARKCGNSHPVKPGDQIVQWIGSIDGQFSPWEECRECVRLGWGMPWLARFWKRLDDDEGERELQRLIDLENTGCDSLIRDICA